MLFILSMILGSISLVLQALVVFYGIKLFRIVGHTNYWSCAWKFYILANAIILLRRIVSFLTIIFVACGDQMLVYVIVEELLAVAVSVLFLLFGKKLVNLFGGYLFKNKE
jgi:hypothetical protein